MKRLTKTVLMMKIQWNNLTVPLLLVATMILGPARIAFATSREYQVKAAFIYNFTQFIEWPKEAFKGPQESFVIGVVGQDPFDGALEQILAGKTVGNRPIVTKHFGTAADVGPC